MHYSAGDGFPHCSGGSAGGGGFGIGVGRAMRLAGVSKSIILNPVNQQLGCYEAGGFRARVSLA